MSNGKFKYQKPMLRGLGYDALGFCGTGSGASEIGDQTGWCNNGSSAIEVACNDGSGGAASHFCISGSVDNEETDYCSAGGRHFGSACQDGIGV